MRAIYYPFFENEDLSSVSLSGESAHHLNVVRARVGEEILLLNGKGTKLFAVIVAIDKKTVIVDIVGRNFEAHQHSITLAIATPKKDAFEDILKIAVELGISHIRPLSSHFSQYDYAVNDRTSRLIESALVQSNNAWVPEIAQQVSLSKFLEELALPLFFFNSRPYEIKKKNPIVPSEFVVLIGPEGGFSNEEISLISQHPHTTPIHLPTPILRAPTAVATSVGYLLALKMA